MRSRAAAANLTGSGFKDVSSMQGGINAWNGMVAEGVLESGMAYFSSAARPEDMMALAWLLEDGTRQFYSQAAEKLNDGETGGLFNDLSKAEEGHKGSIFQLYREFSGSTFDPGFPHSVISGEKEGPVVEGGLRLDEALRWIEGKRAAEILEFSVSLETNSYDLYIKMERQVKDPRSIEVFRVLSAEEKKHLEKLSILLEERI